VGEQMCWVPPGQCVFAVHSQTVRPEYWTQAKPEAQSMPQPPQWAVLLRVSTHAPPQQR